jgi:B12-binding domain/radical SAM domain protein
LRVSLVLVDRPTARGAAVALAGAVEASAIGDRVDLALARGPAEIAAAAGAALGRDARVVVGWSFLSAEGEAVARELALVRAALPSPFLPPPAMRGEGWGEGQASGPLHLAGGAHASADPAAALAMGFDLVARGEGERTIVDLLARVLAGDDPRGAPGLAWRGSGGVETSGRAVPVDLDACPAFTRHLGKSAALEVTRGCVWACRFCHTPFLQRARFRHRSLASARAWARHAVRELRFRDLRFVSPSALSYGASGAEVDLAAVEALLAAVREEAGPGRRIFFGTFPSELRPEHVSREALAVLARRADNREVLLGAQSGSSRLLAAMGRGHGVEEVVRAVHLAREAGFGASVDFIAGLPGETPEDAAASRALMQRVADLGARVHAHAFMPLPGTPWQREAPGEVDAATALLLDRLASCGRAYGQWKGQARVAGRLAAAARHPR